MNTTSVDAYLADGCGRCEHYKTPRCKVHKWTEPLVLLRQILLESELTEEMKWGSPCYTLDGKNVVMLAALEGFCALGFFKGVLLTDPHGLLEAPGPNTQAARQLRFLSADEVRQRSAIVAETIGEAIELERSGAKVAFERSPEPMPEELQARLDEDPTLAAAFDALTPGRQRSFVLHVGQAKQSRTRASRVERCIPKILQGKGFFDR